MPAEHPLRIEQPELHLEVVPRAAARLLESGGVKPIIYRTLPLTEAADAHRIMESSEHIGKIVLTVA